MLIVQRDATQSSLFIVLLVHSKRSGCQPHPSLGLHETLTTEFGTGPIIHLVRHVELSVLYTFLVKYLYSLQYDQYRWLCLQFYVLLMMGVVETRNV